MNATLDAIEEKRQALLARVASMTPAAQQWRESPDSWNAVEIVEHLVLAERVVIGDLRDVAGRPDASRSPGERLRAVIVSLVLRFGVRVTVASESMRPAGTRSFASLRDAWDAQHRALRAYVEDADRPRQRRRVFRHPIAGPLDLPQMLGLLDAHLATHTRQLDRLCAARGALQSNASNDGTH
jgi:hypothetical protein